MSLQSAKYAAADLGSSASKDEIPITELVRHCAFCLNLCSIPVKKCSGCKKRAYCSKECQAKDWSTNGTGQRHKNWCGRFEYGEEDVDWEVVPVPNKGLGVVAKRLIPAGFRIIVEPIFTDPKGHPGVTDLEPKGASLEAKFQLNCTEGVDGIPGEKDFIGLRISRANHNCRPNACCSYDEEARVAILYALQDIQSREEICVNYCPFTRLTPPELEFDACQMSLREHWGIMCPIDCFCNDQNARKLVMEGRRLNDTIKSLVQSGSLDEALTVGEKRLEIQRQLNMSWGQCASLECALFHLAIRKKETLSRAEKYIRSALKVFRIIRPYSKIIEKYEMLLKHPEMDEYYLNLETE